MSGLEGIRVLDIGHMVAAPYATKLLADLGADVIKVEPPGGDGARRRGPYPAGAEGDIEQSGLFLGLNPNKRSIVLDLDTTGGQASLAALVADADIVVHDLDALRAAAVGLDEGRLLTLHPQLVVCAITPFGQSGPHAHFRAEELTTVHAGGWGNLVPGDGTDPSEPPIKVYGRVADFQAGMAGAMAALASFDKAEQTGAGEFIDLSVQAYVASMLEASFIAWTYMGQIANRFEGRLLNPWKILRASDGLIFLVTVEPDQWDRLVDMMGNPEWAELDLFADLDGRAANNDILHLYIEEWTSQHTVDELFHKGQAQRICFAPVFTMADLPRQQHLIERGFFHELNHPAAGTITHQGAPFVATPTTWALRRPAPTLDQHGGQGFAPRSATIELRARDALDSTARPLAGVRVIDFTWVWAGPFCTLNLSHLGADVVKVESSDRPGLGRRLRIHAPGDEVTLNSSGYFNQWDQGKRSVEIDLSSDAGLAQVVDLLAGADVVVDNYATGVMDRLGLSDERLREINPDLIIASITGYGHTGPLKNYMGYGPTTAPLSGLASMTGYLDGVPREAGLSIGDPAAGLTAAFAIVAAVTGKRRGAAPSRIDVSLWEATAVNALEGWMAYALTGEQPTPMANRDPQWAPHGCYPTSGDDEWISIVCTTDDEWQNLAGLIDADLPADPRFVSAADRKRNEDALDVIMSQWTQHGDRWEITNRCQAVGIAAYPSLTCPDIAENPQLSGREFFERLEHPEVGTRTHTGVPWRMTNSPNGVQFRAPLLGEHTAEVLAPLEAP